MEVPPPCCYLMTRGGVGEVNNPAGGARGGGGVRGDRDIFLPASREGLKTFNFANSIKFGCQVICSVKQTLAADS